MYEPEPTPRLKEILEMTDEVKQCRELILYVNELERRCNDWSWKYAQGVQKGYEGTMDQIMKSKPFEDWLRAHDKKVRDEESKDWSGLQEGM